MIKDLKLVIKCYKFACNKKQMIIMFFVFIALGVVNLCSESRLNLTVGCFMFTLAPNLLSQMIQTMNMSNLIASSPKKKSMAVSIPTLTSMLGCLVGIGVSFTAIFISYKAGNCTLDDIGYVMMNQGGIVFLFQVYMAFSYKSYLVASAAFFILFFSAFALMNFDDSAFNVSLQTGLVIAALGVISGAILFFLFSKLLYKYPIDKRALSSTLKSGA